MQTQREAIKDLLRSKKGQRVPVFDIARAFQGGTRKRIAQYNARLYEIKRELPSGLAISNKTKRIDGQKHSRYMLHSSGDKLPSLPINKFKNAMTHS